MKNCVSKVLISDFDGTISKKDFYQYVIDNLLTEPDIQPWYDYLAGKRKHIDALSEIFSKVKMNKDEFRGFILGLPLEECFVKTVEFCNENNIDFYIISAGADYYIKEILDNLKIAEKVTLVTNKSVHSFDQGLRIIKPDKDEPYFSEEYGISKKLVVEEIIKNYDYSIFVGDGGPDFEPAKIVDQIFARDRLLELCKMHNIQATPFNSYCEVLDFLKS